MKEGEPYKYSVIKRICVSAQRERDTEHALFKSVTARQSTTEMLVHGAQLESIFHVGV